MAVSTQPVGTVGLTDILSAIKNAVQAVNALSQNYLNVEGQQNFAALSVPTVVKPSGGRIVRVSVIVAGSASGFIYDSANLTVTTRPMWVIPMTVGEYLVSLPMSFGVMVVPGTGQTVSGSFS